jgi:hypothetical protein
VKVYLSLYHQFNLQYRPPPLRTVRKAACLFQVRTDRPDIRARVIDDCLADTIPCSDLNGETRKNLLNADKVIPLITHVYLPYSLQHTLLVGAQQMLEDSLFKYGSDKMRDVVKTKGWDCSQCVELNDWVKILRKRKDLVPSPKGKTPNRPLSAVLGSVVQLRHTAVHRQKVTALEVQLYLEDAEFLLNFLDDGASAKEISGIRQSLSDHVEDLSAHSNSYQERLRVIAKDKQMQMFQLQLEEHLAVGQVLAESQEYERRATVQFQQRTLRKEFAHARTGSAATLARGDKCDHHVEEETFRFCANCIEDVRTGVRADVEKSFASRKNTIWLSKMVSFTDTTRTRDLLLTRASWRTMVLALLVSLMSFGTLLWIKGIEAGYPTA